MALSLSAAGMRPPQSPTSSGGGLPAGARTATTSPQTPTKGVWTDHIEGRFRRITVHQIAMAWWLHSAGHITRRQLRIYFAAHEMAERRRYTDPVNGPERPLYRIDELKDLVGGRGSATADAELSADLRRLARLGLATVTDHAIDFAVSIDQITVDDVTGFWTMFQQLPHPRRSVPAPRRVIRALAAGFTRGMTAVVLASLIRSLFWHKGQSAYRTDGRTKREWIAETFGISLRTVTDARARLIELGWLLPIDTPQHMLNRYGTHDAINTDWKPSDTESSGGAVGEKKVREGEEAVGGSVVGRCRKVVGGSVVGGQGGSASPNADFSAGFASPDLNRSLPLTGNQNTRRPAPMRAGPAGASRCSALGSRKKRYPRHRKAPRLRDIQAGDLEDMGRMLVLYEQAIKLGVARAGEAGRLDFLAMAERARTRGKRAGALFFWLLRERKTAFITQADEDQANRRLKEHLFGPMREKTRKQWGGSCGGRGGGREEESGRAKRPVFSADEKLVPIYIRVARQHGLNDPFHAARLKGWTRDRWEKALVGYETKRTAVIVEVEEEPEHLADDSGW